MDKSEETRIELEDIQATTPELLPGSILCGKYRIVKTIGRGAFGITYLAYLHGKKVAIKEFFMHKFCNRDEVSQDVTGSSPGNQIEYYGKKFQQEALKLKRLNYDGIVKVYEIFEAHNTFYYSMEYIEGGSLDEYIKERGCIKEDEAVEIIYEIGKAVLYIHDHQLLHLDLKPNNVMRRKDGRLLLIDFGLSKQFDENGEPESSSNIGLGTQGYAPTEQVSHNGKEFAPWIDIYALGGILFKLLTGVKPPNASEILNNGVPINELKDKGVSNSLINCIKKAMNPLWKKRYQNVPQFLSALPLKPEQNLDYAKHILKMKEDIDGLSVLPEYGGKGLDKTGGIKSSLGQILFVSIASVLTAMFISNSLELLFLDGANKFMSWGFIGLLIFFDGLTVCLLAWSKKRKMLRILSYIVFPFFLVLSISQLPWGKIEFLHSQFSNRVKGKGEVVYSVGSEMFTMIPVTPGEFIMGGDGFEMEAYSPHPVKLTKSYFLGETEVTQGLWKAVMGKYSVEDDKVDPNMPVNNVGYDDALDFIHKLNARTGLVFRLPTEAEWEYAARGGQIKSDFEYSGSNDINEVAWYEGNSYKRLHRVATKKPNELGLYDMIGNVEEWCQDMYLPYKKSDIALVDPNYSDSIGTHRVARGGSFKSPDHSMSVKFHNINDFDYHPETCGFRLAM